MATLKSSISRSFARSVSLEAGLRAEGVQERRALPGIRGRHPELEGTNLDDAVARVGAAPRDPDRLLAARGVDDPEAAEQLLALGERAVGYERLAAAHADARALGLGAQRHADPQLSLARELPRVLLHLGECPGRPDGGASFRATNKSMNSTLTSLSAPSRTTTAWIDNASRGGLSILASAVRLPAKEASMKLYGANGSPFFRKARVVLEEKGLRYVTENLVPVPKTPALLALHPLGKIPILRDGEVVVPDSSVICAYLEKKHPSPALYPADPADFAKALFLEEYADTRMAEAMGGVFFERFVKRFVLQQAPDEARVADLLANEVPPVLDYLEGQVPARPRHAARALQHRGRGAGRAPREPHVLGRGARRRALAAHRALLRGAAEASLVRGRDVAVAPGSFDYRVERRSRCSTRSCATRTRRPGVRSRKRSRPRSWTTTAPGRRRIVRSGHYRAGTKLAPTAAATTLREKNGRRVTTDGPFAETREQLGGLHLVECKDLDEALAIAGRIPTLRVGCTVEVRPVEPIPHA